MSTISIEHAHPRPCLRNKTMTRCRNNGEANNVVLIDVDSKNCDNVVIIDITESLPKKNRDLPEKDEQFLFGNVINIDDDETPDSGCSFRVHNGSFSAGTSLNRKSFEVGESSGVKCQFVHDSSTPVTLSKCKRTYSGEVSARNRYGLNIDSECDLSDNDSDECELVEDFSGEVQEMWEKAFSRKMKGTVSDRELLKETDEYKKAVEEEWASRQEALRIQAEDARNQRRLQKRLKAERMRVADMERRQKERIEEVRNIQKKDEENVNLKDAIRTKVRVELAKLEAGCNDMASLLHSLGIRVDSWPHPSSQEVQSAYKRALLTFHPDRASRSDIQKLVEAEEKIKLINRMKEKFPPF